MLSGLPGFPGRGSMWDSGDDVWGCNLGPGPRRFYLDGDDMQAGWNEVYPDTAGGLM